MKLIEQYINKIQVDEQWNDGKEEDYIGVDLDATLAFYESGNFRNDVIGNIIPEMKEKVLKEIASGTKIKIFTARAHNPNAIPYIKKWLMENGLGDLEVTNVKTPGMREIWDDRAKQVIPNTGKFLGEE